MAQVSHIVPELKSLALADLSYLFRREWAVLAPDGDVTVPATKVLTMLTRLRGQVDHVIVCLDTKPYFRSTIFPEYKAQREAPSDACIAQMRWLKGRIEMDGYNIARSDGMEADDIIATLVTKCKARGITDIRIIGADKDAMQLVQEGVRVFVPSMKETAVDGFEVYDGPAVMKKFGVAPCFMPDYQALVGDEGDNIHGINGCGPKTAAKLLNTYGTLQMVLSAAKRGETEIATKVREELVAQAANAKTYRVLTELRKDVELDVDALLEKKPPKPLVKVETVVDAQFEPTKEEPVQTGKHDDLISGKPVREMPTISAKDRGAIMVAPPEPANDIVRHVDDNLQPLTIEGLERVARYFLNARKNKVNTIDEACAIIIRGRELGLTAAAALDNFNIIDGKLSMSADAIQALAEKDANCEYFVLLESTEERAVYEIKLRNFKEPRKHEFTMADAERAGLARNNNYRRWPKAMLRARCKAEAARIYFPGSAKGLYCKEELDAHLEAA